MKSNAPCVLQCSDSAGAKRMLIIDYIPPMEALLAEANEADLRAVAPFTAESRRRERLAWRVMLRRALGRDFEVEYLPSGKPQLRDAEFSHISVSHCRDMVAVALSTRECGVDVELLERRFAAVAERYISDEELSLVHSDYERAVIWAAKECLYKMAHCEGLDLKEHIRIEAIDGATSLVRGVVRHHDKELLRCELHLLQPDTEHILLYAF